MFALQSSTRHLNSILAWHQLLHKTLSPLRMPHSTPSCRLLTHWVGKKNSRRDVLEEAMRASGREGRYSVNTQMFPQLKYHFQYHQIMPTKLFTYQHFSVIFHPDSSTNWNSSISHFFPVVKLHPLSSLKIADFHLSAKSSVYLEDSNPKDTLDFWSSHTKNDFICGIFRPQLEVSGNPINTPPR